MISIEVSMQMNYAIQNLVSSVTILEKSLTAITFLNSEA